MLVPSLPNAAFTRGVVVLVSGGMDSSTLLYQLRAELNTHPLHALSFDYGQRHKKELECAANIALLCGAEHTMVDLSAVGRLFTKSALTTKDVDVPEGHYTMDNMTITVVPNRNMIMMSVAAGYAVNHNLGVIAMAAHAGDHIIYPDCRPEYVASFQETVRLANAGMGGDELCVYTPFAASETKADIARLGHELGVPWHMTWSCYKGQEKHCGKCGTCVERREAFELAEVEDPTEYE